MLYVLTWESKAQHPWHTLCSCAAPQFVRSPVLTPSNRFLHTQSIEHAGKNNWLYGDALYLYLWYRPRRNWMLRQIVGNSMLRRLNFKQNIFIKQITRCYSLIKSDLIWISGEYSLIIFHIQLFHHASRNGKTKKGKKWSKLFAKKTHPTKISQISKIEPFARK